MTGKQNYVFQDGGADQNSKDRTDGLTVWRNDGGSVTDDMESC